MRLSLCLVAACMLGTGAPLSAFAQRTDTATVALPAVSVTATRTSLPARALPVTVSVFDRATLREAGITQVADVMRLVPGATVLTSGSFGGLTSLFFRGGQSNYVQVLVDGVPLNAPGGAFDFGQLTLDNVDRVEVVRGPASVLYGSDAVSGVIQIFTRTGTQPGAHISGLVGAGSYGAREYEGGASGKSGNFAWSFDGARHSTNGILPFNNEFRNTVGSGAVRWKVRRFDASASLRLTDFTYHFPTNSAGVPTDSNQFDAEKRTVAALDVGWRVNYTLELRARAAHDRATPTLSNLPDNATDPNLTTSDATVTRDLFEERAIFRLGATHVLTLSAEHTHDHQVDTTQSVSAFGSFPGGLRADRTNDGVAAQIIGNIGSRLTYTGGLRRDDNSAFGIFTTTRIGAAVRLSSATHVRASFGTAFSAPTFEENFSIDAFDIGNPTLTPERTRTTEIGIEHTIRGSLTIVATAFWQRFHDLIEYIDATPNYANLAAASADGVELKSSWRVQRGLLVRGSFTWLDTKVTDAGADEGESATFVNGERLLRRPKYLATVGMHEALPGNGSFDADLTYTGARNDRDFNQFPATPVVMKAFTLVNLATVTPIKGTRGVEHPAIVLRVQNALNTGYQQILGFRAPGRTYFLGVRLGD